MPQEHYVLRCFSCEKFQVHMVKKSKKWQCKICNEKQSFLRHYGMGSSTDCRNQIMKLTENIRIKEFQLDNEQCFTETKTESNERNLKINDTNVTKLPKGSKWLQYLDEDELENGDGEITEKEDILSDECNNFENNPKRRKVTHENSLPPETSKANALNWNTISKLNDISNSENQLVKIDQEVLYEKTQASDNTKSIKSEIKKRKFDEYLNDSNINKNSSQEFMSISYQKSIFGSNPSDLDDILNINF